MSPCSQCVSCMHVPKRKHPSQTFCCFGFTSSPTLHASHNDKPTHLGKTDKMLEVIYVVRHGVSTNTSMCFHTSFFWRPCPLRPGREYGHQCWQTAAREEGTKTRPTGGNQRCWRPRQDTEHYDCTLGTQQRRDDLANQNDLAMVEANGVTQHYRRPRLFLP